MILAGLFTPWWIILAAPTGRCFLSWTSSTVHSHRAAPEAHRPFPPVSPRPPRTFHDLSLFFYSASPSPLLCFCEGLPRGSNGVPSTTSLWSRDENFASPRFEIATLWTVPLLQSSSLSLSLLEDYRILFYHLSYRSRKEEYIFLCAVF